MKSSFVRKAAATIFITVVFVAAGAAQSKKIKTLTDRDQLIGTWHLVNIDSPTTDGGPQPPLPIGLLIFTADGYQAVQLMYPKEASTLNNKFVHDGSVQMSSYDRPSQTISIWSCVRLIRSNIGL